MGNYAFGLVPLQHGTNVLRWKDQILDHIIPEDTKPEIEKLKKMSGF